MTACYIALVPDSGRIAGFYTLSASQIAVGDLPEGIRHKRPRYPAVPAVRPGRLAVEQ